MPGENKNPAGEAGATGAAGAATLKRIPDKEKVEENMTKWTLKIVKKLKLRYKSD